MSKIKDIILTAAELSKNSLLKSIHKSSKTTDEFAKKILQEVESKGFYVIDSFYTEEQCELARKAIDQVSEDYKNDLWIDEDQSDFRAWGINQVSEEINKFYTHPFLQSIREQYYKLNDEFINGFTMAGKLKFVKNNKGSGGGWHRDTVNDRQLKAILYLTDVTAEHGPFEYLINTQLKTSIYETIRNNNIKYNQNRFTPEEIKDIIKKNKYPLATLTGSIGSLIIVDTSGIHRGMPIQKETRYALTNYYFVDKRKGGKGIPNNIKEILLNK